MITKFFAPFISKAAEAKKNYNDMFFFELYFYVLLPYGMYYYGELLCSYMDIYNDTAHLPWYTFFSNGKLSIMFIFACLPLLCIMWQFFSLRTFSACFFIALWSFLAALISINIVYYIILNETIFIQGAFLSISYGCVIYYFYNRKHLFTQNKNNNMPIEK